MLVEREAYFHVPDPFLNKLELIWAIFSKFSKMHFFKKASGANRLIYVYHATNWLINWTNLINLINPTIQKTPTNSNKIIQGRGGRGDENKVLIDNEQSLDWYMPCMMASCNTWWNVHVSLSSRLLIISKIRNPTTRTAYCPILVKWTLRASNYCYAYWETPG